MTIDKQQIAIDLILKQKKNVFLTGGGGRGKSHIIRQITDDNTLLVAPTGIAALNIGGITCHKGFGLPFGLPTPKDAVIIPKTLIQLFNQVQDKGITRIIIDEISMLRVDYFDLINTKLQSIKRNNKPFGGIQMVVVGDFLQLEPIVSKTEHQEFYSKYTSPFCFTSVDNWNFETVILTKNYRTTNPEQTEILDQIRYGNTEYLEAINNSPLLTTLDPEYLYLCAYNKDSDRINKEFYNKHKGKVKSYKATYKGLKTKWKDAIVEDKISLKTGLKVLICANDIDNTYVNGDRGKVVSLGTNYIEVELDRNQETVLVEYTRWDKYKYEGTGSTLTKKVDTSMSQLPIKLGYSISTHKSQGMTLDNVCLDIGEYGCFSHGQLYVALSRIRDLNNLRLLRKIPDSSLIVRQEVLEYYKQLEESNDRYN